MTIDEVEKIKTVVENKDYIVQLVNTVAKTMVGAFENLKIEDVNMFQLGYNKAIDDFTGKIKENISESLIWGMITDCFKYKNMNDTSDKIVDYVINTANEIAEQLKRVQRMNKAFEKILEKLEEELRKSEERYHRYLDDSNLPCMFDKSDIEETRVDTIKEMLEIVQEVAEEYKGGWISVKDRLPDKADSYLVIGKSGGATITRWYMPSEFYPEGHFGGNSSDYIRYWMPRPEPPKERD